MKNHLDIFDKEYLDEVFQFMRTLLVMEGT